MILIDNERRPRIMKIVKNTLDDAMVVAKQQERITQRRWYIVFCVPDNVSAGENKWIVTDGPKPSRRYYDTDGIQH